MTDPSLPEAMERGGVEGEPGIGPLERTERKRLRGGFRGPVMLVVHHRVRRLRRLEAGLRRARDRPTQPRRDRAPHLPGPLDPNRVVVHNDFPSEEAARAFATDPSLPEAMERGGVQGEPVPGFAGLAERKVYAGI